MRSTSGSDDRAQMPERPHTALKKTNDRSWPARRVANRTIASSFKARALASARVALAVAETPLWFRRLDWSLERLEEFRRKRLREVIGFAYLNIPAYRRLWQEAGTDPLTIGDFESLQALPIVDKGFFRAYPIEQYYSDLGFGELYLRRTSGSTGVSLLFAQSRRNRYKRIMVDLRANIRLGYRPSETFLVVASPEAQLRRNNALQRLGLFRRRYVSADLDIEELASKIEAVNPHVLQCYPSHLLLLAQMKPAPRLGRLRRIICAGEVLTEQARATIEAAFGVKVSNFYGAKELGMIAWECRERSGMHINWDLYHVEQMPDTNELVITLLDDEAMPFVRYNTHDRGIIDFSPCPCGCRFPRITAIEGRADDCIVAPDGTRIPPLRVNFVDFTGHSQAHAYQVRQDRPGHIEVLLVPTPNFDLETCQSRIRRQIDQYLCPELSFEIKLVDHIPKDPSGKLRSVISFANKQRTERP